MSQSLNPCPFCGCRDDELAVRRNPHDNSFNVACSCGAVGPDETSKLTAVSRWNRRFGEDELVDRIADFVETWGGAPPNPYGQRAQLAADIRARLFDREVSGDMAAG